MMRRPRRILFGVALVFIAASLACSIGAGSMAPQPTEASAEVVPGDGPGQAPAEPLATEEGPGEVPVLPAPSDELAGPPTFAPDPPAPAIPERRRLTLEFPPVIRAGDADVIYLTLEVDELGRLTPTARVGGNEVSGEVLEIPNLYETHTVFAEARLDLAGVEVSPPGEIVSQLLPGRPVVFSWSVSPREVGSFRGTVWLHLRFVDKVSSAESRQAISAQTIEVAGSDFLGFSGNTARTLGMIGSITGGVIGFPFLQDILKFLWKRRRRASS